MPTVLIAPGPLRHQPGRFREVLETAGFTTVDPDGGPTLNGAELRSVLPAVDAMLAGGELLSAELLDLAPRLRVIARTGVGYDTVDVDAATDRGIVVTITPGTNHDSVAEHTFALLLALTRRIVVNDGIIRRGGWDRTTVAPLRGKTLGLVGLGRIGRAVATRGLAFGMRVVAFDPIASAEFDAHHRIERLDLPSLLAVADVVSLHAPLNEATRGLFDHKTLALMKPGALLLNTARGGLVVEADLFDSLANGHLAGAGLDVLEPEPPRPDHPLLGLPHVVFSPHIAGVDAQSLAEMAEMAARCVVDLREGRWPAECVVNGVLGHDWRWSFSR